MGRVIAGAVADSPDCVLGSVWTRDPVAAAEHFPAATRFEDDVGAVARGADVLIDFSLPEGTVLAAAAAAEYATPFVCGVSGLDAAHFASVERAAEQVPVVFDRNMSQGVAVLAAVVERVASALGTEFSVSIDETHHRHKLDAPSGTALGLGELIAAARGQSFDEQRWYEPERPDAEAPSGAIRFHVERRGEVPGNHTVRFESGEEALVFGHSVTTRDVFAAGAIRAARWLKNREPGLYSMRDVLAIA